MGEETFQNFITILNEELIPALGCTEPIAVAYAAAKARDVLGLFPGHITVFCSGNIVKNVKSVTVPNSNGLRGIDAAATLGTVGGRAEKELEVLDDVKPEDIERTKALLAEHFCDTRLVGSVDKLYLKIQATLGQESASVTIQGHHTNITDIERNGRVLFHCDFAGQTPSLRRGDRSRLSVRSILEFADRVEIARIEPVLSRQIRCNMRICQEGLSAPFGAGVAGALLEGEDPSVFTVARAKAAAASEARMSGCPLPVVINSGSGNQGITVSVPVIEYVQAHGLSQEQLYRALAVSNLISIHLKYFIGDLSAFCGAVTAACGTGAALAYLEGIGYRGVADTITNTLAAVSGIFCDGAKPSCAAKISSALDAAFLSLGMARRHSAFHPGEGVVGEDVEQTIRSVGHIGRNGMDETDQEILRIMMQTDSVSRDLC